jgi:hypothetical protein
MKLPVAVFVLTTSLEPTLHRLGSLVLGCVDDNPAVAERGTR